MAGYRRGIALRGAVVVVTAAAGPVGRAVAPALAAAGARPVLLDGPDTDLAGAAASALSSGPAAPWPFPGPGGPGPPRRTRPAEVVTADVTVAADVAAAAAEVVRRCGRIDGWVHVPPGPSTGDAGAGVPGGLLDLPLPALRHGLDTALLGAVHGARAAVPHLAADGGGVLVLLASVHAQVARPSGAVPGVAGAGVRVLAAALRQELRGQELRGQELRHREAGGAGVAVTAVLTPEVGSGRGGDRAATDTTGVLRAGSLRPFPAGRPDRIAATVLAQLRRPRLEKVAGGPVATALVHGHALAPGATEWLVAHVGRRRRPPAPPPARGG